MPNNARALLQPAQTNQPLNQHIREGAHPWRDEIEDSRVSQNTSLAAIRTCRVFSFLNM